jgi:hypothetical protein
LYLPKGDHHFGYIKKKKKKKKIYWELLNFKLIGKQNFFILRKQYWGFEFFLRKCHPHCKLQSLFVKGVHAIVNLANMCELIKSIEFETTLLIFSFICGY